jgi:hypothetical protein
MQKIIFAYSCLVADDAGAFRSANPLDYQFHKVVKEGEDLAGFLETDGMETLISHELETVAAVFLCEDLPHGTRFTLIA